MSGTHVNGTTTSSTSTASADQIAGQTRTVHVPVDGGSSSGAAGGTFAVDTDRLAKCSPTFAAIAASVEAARNKMLSTMDQLGKCWGEDQTGDEFADTYVEAAFNMRSGMLTLVEVLRSAGDGIATMAKGTKQSEEQAAEVAGGKPGSGTSNSGQSTTSNGYQYPASASADLHQSVPHTSSSSRSGDQAAPGTCAVDSMAYRASAQAGRLDQVEMTRASTADQCEVTHGGLTAHVDGPHAGMADEVTMVRRTPDVAYTQAPSVHATLATPPRQLAVEPEGGLFAGLVNTPSPAQHSTVSQSLSAGPQVGHAVTTSHQMTAETPTVGMHADTHRVEEHLISDRVERTVRAQSPQEGQS